MYVKNLKFFVLLFLVNFLACTPDQDIFNPDTNDHPIDVDSGTSDFQTAFLDAVNAYRTAGCKCGNKNMPPVAPLKWNSLLEEAATRHTNDMASNEHFAHKGTDNSSIGQRIADTGYLWRAIGENIAFGYPNIQAVVDAWIESEGHCKNIMNENFTEMGAAEKNSYWTQDLARPQ